MEQLKKFANAISGEAGFVAIVIIVVAALFALAVLAERSINKREKQLNAAQVQKTKKIVLIGAFSALAAVLMYIEFPLPFAPEFYKVDFSEIPVIISGFMLGPVEAVATEFVKILIKLIIKPTSTAFVGEFANFVVGCAFVIPASVIYRLRKTRARAYIGMAVGTITMTALGAFTNAFVLLPAFAYLYGGMPVDALISMGTEVNSAIGGMFSFIMLAVVPLNLVKGIGTALIVGIIYKSISRLIKSVAHM